MERMKVELVNSFLYSPRLIFLDEPTIGLDIGSQDAIREFIREYRQKKGASILLTSHDMDDIENTCDRILVLKKGKLAYALDVEELKKKSGSFRGLSPGKNRSFFFVFMEPVKFFCPNYRRQKTA